MRVKDGKIQFLNISEYVTLGYSVFVPATPELEKWRGRITKEIEKLIEVFDIDFGFIHAGGGDWCLALKGNQESLLSDARGCFTGLGPAHPEAVTAETGHGRKETRKAVVVSAKALGEYHEFPALKAFGRIEATREMDGKVTRETRFFALSWMPAPEVLLTTVRAHWAIENALHWQLDVSFREDAARNRKDNAPGNIAVLRRRALDLVRQDKSKASLSIKLKRAGWDEGFLRSILTNIARA